MWILKSLTINTQKSNLHNLYRVYSVFTIDLFVFIARIVVAYIYRNLFISMAYTDVYDVFTHYFMEIEFAQIDVSVRLVCPLSRIH